MANNKTIEFDIKVGIFVMTGIALVATAIITLGSSDSLLTRTYSYFTHFESIDGLIPGAKVSIGGFQVGSVTSVEFDREKRNLRVTYKVGAKYSEWVRADSAAEILTQGMLGDKFISISQGTAEQPALREGSELPAHRTKGLTEVLSQGDQLVTTLNSLASSLDQVVKGFQKNGRSEKFFEGVAQSSQSLAKQLDGLKLKESVDQLHGILKKVENGTGTLGALINDPGLYYDIRALMGGANRNKVMRNLVRQTIKDGEKRNLDSRSGP